MFLQTRNGMFLGSQHSLFMPVCKELLSPSGCMGAGINANTAAGSLWTWLGFFVLFGRGCMNNSFPASYAWGNFSVLAVGIWAIVQRDSLDAIVMVSVRAFASTRGRVEGRKAPLNWWWSSAAPSAAVNKSNSLFIYSSLPEGAWLLLKHNKLWWEAFTIHYFASRG